MIKAPLAFFGTLLSMYWISVLATWAAGGHA